MARKEKNNNTTVGFLRDIKTLLDTPRSAFGEMVSEGLFIQSGWIFAYNLDPVFVNIVVDSTGSVSHDGAFAKLETGTATDGYAEINTKRSLAYTPGIGAVAKFTAVFNEPVENTLQLIGIGTIDNGWFFGYHGLKFGVVRINNSEQDWTYQEEWNKNKFNNLIPQKGNVYQIDFQYLGFGDQYFSIEDGEGDIVLAHQISYSNKNIDVSVQNPSIPLSAIIKNNGNNTNMILRTPSSVAGSYGDIDSSAFSFPVGYDQVGKTALAGIESYLFSIRNPEEFLGKNNGLYIDPSYLSVASDGTKSVIIRIYFNATLTDPVWADIAAGISPAQADISATDYSGGLKVLTLSLGKGDSKILDLDKFRGLISGGGAVTITAESINDSEITTGITFRSRV